jgi:SAM-dependent methyltransferase
MEKVNCDLCGSSNHRLIARQTDLIHGFKGELFSIVECLNCRLNFLNPRPSPSEIGSFYAHDYAFHQNKARSKEIVSFLIDKIANSLLAYLFIFAPKKIQDVLSRRIRIQLEDPIMKAIRNSNRRLKILDIGCGSGLSAHYWGWRGGLLYYSKFAECYGVEIEGESVKLLEKNKIITKTNLEQMNHLCRENKIKFDFIRMNWSLEHVHSPSECFQFIRENLELNGKAIIGVPNYDGNLYRLAKDLVEVPVHLYHFSPSDIQNYAVKFGLKITSKVTFSYPGMFLHAGEIYKPFKAFKNMGLLECIALSKFLQTFDDTYLGNDLLVELELA